MSDLSKIDELVALFTAGRFQEVENRARELLAIDPAFGFGWKALGAAIQSQGGNALPSLQKALELMPTDPGIRNNLGNSYKGLGQLDKAVQFYRSAIELNPDYPEAYNNLGNALSILGQLDQAIDCYRRALELRPDFAEAVNNMGNPLRNLGRLDEAVVCFRRALNLKPEYSEAHNNLGNVLWELGQINAAVRCYLRALELKPDYADACNNLGTALRDLGQLDEALRCYQRALQIRPDYLQAYSNLLFVLNCMQSSAATVLKEEAQRFGKLVLQRSKPFLHWPGSQLDPHRPLRIGFVSGDLRSHPVGFFLESVVSALTQRGMELSVYQTHSKVDGLTARLKVGVRNWTVATGISDEKLAAQIHADGIDVLIDLSGHTAHNRLPVFAWKPAPVQVTWLGYFATTGVPGIDYILADPWAVPPSDDAQFSEKVWRLPETRLCFSRPEVSPGVEELPAIASGYVTVGCFNNLAKLNDEVLDTWARVLKMVPSARLFLKAHQLNDAIFQSELLVRFERRGIQSSRLLLEGYSSRFDYLRAYGKVDFALDTFPYPGGATTMEAMWMGVPVLTLEGDRLLSRQGESLLKNADLGDWIAKDRADYVARAVSKSADIEGLKLVREGLRKRIEESSLLDAHRFAIYFEAALREMWQRRCEVG